MLKNIPGSETHIHLCEQTNLGSQIMKISPQDIGKRHGVQVQIHDIHPHIFIEATKTLLPITYCPFCGADIDKEDRP